jgi:streptogramin lyase
VVDYLAKNFPEKPMPPAVIIPGSVDASIKEWTVPTPGSRPHDPMYAPDGSVWYTGNASNLLGRFDPATGEFKEYHLKVPHSGPHGLVADKDGNIWFTANQAAYVGKLDPKTGSITEYKMPDPDARDPHTPIFDHNGVLWFTLQGADMIGRLTPGSGEVKLARVPTAKALPYGMAVDSKGTVYFDEFGANKLGSIDPATVYRLRERPSRTIQSPNAPVQRMALSRGRKIAALRNHHRGRNRVVQRIRNAAEHRGTIRPGQRKIPDVGDPFRRRGRPQHGPHARRGFVACLQRRQRHR